MSDIQSSIFSIDAVPINFRPFTRDSLREIRRKMSEELSENGMEKKSTKKTRPNPKLKQGVSLPIRLAAAFTPEMINIPLEDVDTFYFAIPTFIVVNKRREISRFSATDSLWLFSPFSPIRRVSIYVLYHSLFAFVIIATIVLDCAVLTMPKHFITEPTELILTAIYTFEFVMKIIARGFILEKFTYLRDGWNWLDFALILALYLTTGINLGNGAFLRIFRLLRAISFVPGLKNIVRAVIGSVRNLGNVVILTLFALSVFALVAMQLYMGVLTQKCVRDFPDDGSTGLNRDVNWHNWVLNWTNWYPYPPPDEYGAGDFPICGNSSGAELCPANYTCLQGYGRNPNYGYASFDSFGWAFFSALRLMTQDFWDKLYQQILRAAGPWHVVYFIVIIFLGSYYLENLILASIARTYDQLQKQAEKDKLTAAAEKAALRAEETFITSMAKAKQTEVQSEHKNNLQKEIGKSQCFVPSTYVPTSTRKRSISLPGSPLNYSQVTYQPGMDLCMISSRSHQSHSPNNASDMENKIMLKGEIECTSAPPSRLDKVKNLKKKTFHIKKLIKQTIVNGCFKCIDIYCIWECGYPWSWLKKKCSTFISDPFTELFITVAIVMNTIFMALDHHGVDQNWKMAIILKIGHEVFTTIFTMECALKLIVMSPKYYFQIGWNIFDFVMVTISLVELMVGQSDLPQEGINAFKIFRVLRVFKIAKSWPTMNLLITITFKTMGDMGNLVFVLFIIIFILAVIGKQWFDTHYHEKMHLFPGRELPRWNFTDFGHSFMIIFRVLCGEWVELMWDCMLVSDISCMAFFLTTLVIGDLVVVNLFLAVLLRSYGVSNLSSGPNLETKKLTEVFQRIRRFISWMKPNFHQMSGIAPTTTMTDPALENPVKLTTYRDADEILIRKEPFIANTVRMAINREKIKSSSTKQEQHHKDAPEIPSLKSLNHHTHHSKEIKLLSSNSNSNLDTDNEGRVLNDDLVRMENEKCEELRQRQDSLQWKESEFETKLSPEPKTKCCTLLGMTSNFRLKMLHLIENNCFKMAVTFTILLSSLALAFEDVYLSQNPVLADLLLRMDRIFTVIFFLEMCIKWTALGLRAYFANVWCWLNFIIVVAALTDLSAALAGVGGMQPFGTIRMLRALRPLQVIPRIHGLKTVVDALVQAIPNIFKVLQVCLVFWLIFAIMGVQLFNGKFYKCIDPEDETRPDYRIIRNRDECLANNFTWENSAMNFDHVGNAYLSLVQVAIFKGWIGIMHDAVDSRGHDEQPHREINFGMYAYFVIFIIFGSFFTLNLFIGVIIDNFKEQKKKSGGSMDVNQQMYYTAKKKFEYRKPIKSIPKPTWKLLAILFEAVTNKKFDMVIMLFILLNMLVMTLDHYQMSQVWTNFLTMMNSIFVAIFTCECLLKILSFGRHYFTESWNLFDLGVVLISITGMVLSDLIETQKMITPALFRVLNVVKVGRVLRLLKGTKEIRTLLYALSMSLPALFNIILLLFLVMFIFSIIGMSFFMNVKLRGGLDEVHNFQTFGHSFILLFQISTSAGWDGVLEGIINEDDCESPKLGTPGNCGNTVVGIAFLLSYLMISFFIVTNMYIAVILDNYSHAIEEVQEGLSDDDFDMYYETLAQFDPDGTQYINYDQLSDFFNVLERPFRIRKPNEDKIISMEIPICKGDKIHSADILDSLMKDFFARKGNVDWKDVEINELQSALDRPGYDPVSSTLWRQREEYYAHIIQNAWRIYRRISNKKETDQLKEKGAVNIPPSVMVVDVQSNS